MTRRNIRRAATKAGARAARYLRSFGAIAHFDPEYRATDDGTTSTWVDRINGYTVASTSQATRLQYSATLAGLNNRPGWTGVAANLTRLVSSDGVLAGLLDGDAPFTAYCVRKWASGVGTVWACGSTANGHGMLYGTQSSGQPYAQRYDGGGTGHTGLITGTDARVDCVVYSGTELSQYSNGGPSTTATANTRAPTCDRFSVGGRMLAGSWEASHFDGLIGDICIFPTAHTDAERMYVERLLAAKYGWPVLQGLSGFSTSNYLATTANLGVRGADGVGAHIEALIRPDAVPAAFQVIAQAYTSGTHGGISLDNSTGGAAFAPRAGNGTATVIAPTRTIAAGDVGKLMLMGGTADMTYARTYINGAEVSSGSALVDYDKAASSKAMTVGQDSGSGGAVSFSIFGLIGGDVPQTAANQAARAAAIKAAQKFVTTGGATPAHAWTFDSVAATYSDLVGSDALTLTGTLSATQIVIPTWPW